MKFTKYILLVALIPLSITAHAGKLQTLANMERQRADLLATYLDSEQSIAHKQRQITGHQTRLIDLERMVLRDDRLSGNKDRLVRLTFSNYDLSFLLHASAEADRAPIEQWLSSIGLGTNDILEARPGIR